MRMMITQALVLAFFATSPLLAADDLNDELMARTRKGDLAGVKSLLEKGADVNAKSPYGQTPLFFACDRGHTEIAKLLIDKGADVNVKDTFYNATALTWASSKGHVEIVKLLLAKGAQGVDAVLIDAVQGDKPELAKLALETGKVKPNTLNYAMSMAVKAKKDSFVELLKNAGAQMPTAKPAVTVEPTVLETYAGKYTGGRGGTEMELVISMKDGKLSLANPGGGNPLNLSPVSNTQFRVTEVEGLEIEFVSKEGKIAGMNLVQAGNTREFTRVVAK